jgi:pentatricopeptide repeat domain-containing protein 1
VQPDVIGFSATISACQKGGQWQKALSVFAAMPEATVKPNVISFDAAIGACEKGGQRQMALILLEEMRIAGCNISS